MDRINAARIRYNANSRGASVGDCVKRSLTIAYSMDYDQVASELNRINRAGYHYEEGYSKPAVFNKFLAARGDRFVKLPRDQYCTVVDFCNSHPTGVYLILVGKDAVGGTTHMVAVVNGDYYDSWESGKWYVKEVATVQSGKSDTFEIDYEACMKEIADFEHTYLDELNTKCPEGMYVSIRRVYNSTYERDEGYIVLNCQYGDKDMLPVGLQWKANRYCGHTIVVKFNPRISAEDNIAILKKKVKQKTYDWVYTLRKEILDEQAAESIQPNDEYTGDKLDLLKVPEWARPLVTSFYDNGNNDWSERFEVDMEALPGDPRAKESPSVLFRAETLTALKHAFADYKSSYARFGYDY